MSGEALKQGIRREAEAKAKKILEDAKDEAGRILAEAETKSMEIVENRVKDARKRMDELVKSEAAKARMECAKRILGIQSQYMEEAFRMAEARVEGLPDSDPELYGDMLLSFIKEGIVALDCDSVVIAARERDRALVEDILKRLEAVPPGGRLSRISVSDKPVDASGGVVMHSGDERVYYVSTFESRLQKSREELRAKVLATLRGKGRSE